MNRECNGHFFTAEGYGYYRCLLNGKLVKSRKIKDDKCPVCNRLISGSKEGILNVTIVVTVEKVVKLPGFDVVLNKKEMCI